METHDLLNVADDEARKAQDAPGGAAFVLSSRPIVPPELREQSSRVQSRDYENLGELPRFYGRPVLFGIARDPHTLFVYWEIDWKSKFGDKPPADRKVHLRVICEDGSEETRLTVEPFAGNHCVAVSQARGIYRVELGYHEPAEVWNSVATSEAIATPPDDVSESGDIDVATVDAVMVGVAMVGDLGGGLYMHGIARDRSKRRCRRCVCAILRWARDYSCC
jgi:hypothetical protein